MIDARIRQLTLFCLFSGMATSAVAQQDNMPALLQFAEQYQKHKAPDPLPPISGESKSVRPRPSLPASPAAKKQPGQDRQLADAQIRQQQTQITQLKQQVTGLEKMLEIKNASPSYAVEPDVKGLSTLAQNLKQVLAPQPTQQKMLANLQQAQLQNETQRNIANALHAKISSAEKENQALQNQQKTLRAQYQTTLSQQQKQSAELDKLQAELTRRKAAAPNEVTSESLQADPARQSYAAGISLGEEIIQMQTERQTWGVKTDKKLVLAGLIDAFSGQRKLTDSELNQALSTSEKNVLTARNTLLKKQEKQDASYLKAFKQGKNVKQAAEGFWYRVEYVGDDPITEQAIVDVVVKEMLTDGTVIQDMEANGIMISQKVTDFPPLFQAAIKLLKNHGSMQLVAPPELVYGEKGYPPQIPPNATMVYTLRIAEMYPENKKPMTARVKKEAKY